MIRQLIVPIDGSSASWRAFGVAVELANQCDAEIRLVEVARDPAEVGRAKQRLDTELAARDVVGVNLSVDVRLTYESVAVEIQAVVSSTPDSIVVMSSVGRGRSAAIVGSVALDVLRRSHRSVMLVGPKAVTSGLQGPIIVTTDGSTESEAALPDASQWADDLDTAVVIATVGDPAAGWLPTVFMANGYMTGLAERVREMTDCDVDVAVLAGPYVGRAVVRLARQRSASIIVASSHGRGGVARVVLGSVTSDFIRKAPCPVIVVRPTTSTVC